MSRKNGTATDKRDVDARNDAAVTTTSDAERSRRHFLTLATATMGAIGAAIAAWPFIASWRPSAKARALGSSVQFDVSRLAPGEQATVVWRGQPIWILRRTPAMLERLSHDHWRERLRDPDSEVVAQQPDYAQNPTRSVRPEVFVAVALCTHLGCVPTFRPEPSSDGLGDDWMGGYFCPCHGSKFDLAGRVTKNVPAPTNLVIPPHRYLSADKLEIGVDRA